MTQIWWVRHGQTDYNLERRWQGQVDVPLNQTGIEQATSLLPHLKEISFDEVWCSDLQRARQTAMAALHPQVHAEIQYSPQLREMSFGAYEGLTYQQIVDRGDAAVFDKWKQDPHRFVMPEGESFGELVQRVQRWLNARSVNRILAVAHGGTIRAAMNLADPQLRWDTIVENGSVTVMSMRPQPRIVVQSIIPGRSEDSVHWNSIVPD